ncbi:MAG: hypothetical protein ACE5K0_07000, partial [Candidatus Methanofastidiosia archaeon]
VDPFGNSYVTWYGYDGSDWEIYFVKISSAGTAGTVQKISTHADNITRSDYDPQIAVDPFGNSYVTWYGYDGSDWEIYFVKISSAGTAGTVQKISTHADNITRDDYDPQIAVDSCGNSYVTWNGYDGSDYEIYFTSDVDVAKSCGRRRHADTTKPMMGRATNTIKDAKELLSKAEGLCDGLREKDDPKFDECCSENKFSEARELLEMAEKFFSGGNYIAANNFALKAIAKLEEIIECCEG